MDDSEDVETKNYFWWQARLEKTVEKINTSPLMPFSCTSAFFREKTM
jgi:hypothetical protein